MPRLKDSEDNSKLLCRTISNKLTVLPLQNIPVFMVCHWEVKTLLLPDVDALRLLLVCCLDGGLDQALFSGWKKKIKKERKKKGMVMPVKKHLGKGWKLQLFCCCNTLFAFHLLQAVSFSQKLAISQGMPCSLFSRRLVVHAACQPGKSIIQRVFRSGSSSWLLEKVCCLLCLSAPRA